MPPPKLYLNEHLSPRLAEQLRQHGFDVTATFESKRMEADDTVDVLRRRLLRLLNSLSAEELKNQIRWLNEFK